MFQFSTDDNRPSNADKMFNGLASASEKNYSGGVVRTRGDNLRTLAFAASTVRDGKVVKEGFYELGADMKLVRKDDAAALGWTKKSTAVPKGIISVDEASVLFTDDSGRRWRLPKGDAALMADAAIPLRVDREVCTERDLFQAMGTFYELPAENAGGFAKIRPVTTHNLRITDYCSYRGLLVLAGLAADHPKRSDHIIRSDDGLAALWVGGVDDLWKLGKPRGTGGPWMNTAVKAGQPSDPYLIAGYDRKQIRISHQTSDTVSVRMEVDSTGSGQWSLHQSICIGGGKTVSHRFPEGFHGYWIRLAADRPCSASTTLTFD